MHGTHIVVIIFHWEKKKGDINIKSFCLRCFLFLFFLKIENKLENFFRDPSIVLKCIFFYRYRKTSSIR